MKFAANGTLYRGSKPVMWSVVEKTALAEAEVEYEDYTSDTVWVKFPVSSLGEGPAWSSAAAIEANGLATTNASVVIWTTTPWTLPGNRAISFSSKIGYGLYKVTDAPADNWAKTGDLLDARRQASGRRAYSSSARVTAYREGQRHLGRSLDATRMRPSARGVGGGYDFNVPLLDGDHVTDDTGTGFVHTAPGHGREDFDIWTANARAAGSARHLVARSPTRSTRTARFTDHAPGFTGKRVINDKGEKGDANEAVIKALVERRQAARARRASSISIRIPGAPRSR